MDPLLIPAFIAGVIIFFAPCTLPVIPAYLGFLTGVSGAELRDATAAVRRKALVNSLLFSLGFTVVFMALGLAFGLGGAALLRYRGAVSRIGGVFIMLFGLFMVMPADGKRFAFLQRDTRPRLKFLRPGKPFSALLFGATFSLGWSPCIGPVLGSVLLLAAGLHTAIRGSILLLVFSLGLAIPFLLVALGVGHATQTVVRWAKQLRYVEAFGGGLLIIAGALILFDKTSWWTGFVYEHLQLIKYERILDLL